METLSFTFPAGEPVSCDHAPHLQSIIIFLHVSKSVISTSLFTTFPLAINVGTSVNGSAPRWQQLFQRLFAEQLPPAMNIDIHDFGATPGVVRLRLEQGFEEIAHD